jgi:hypothetical protein
LAAHLGSSVADLQIQGDRARRHSLQAGEAEVAKQESLIRELRDENVRLKQCHDEPLIASRLKQVQSEIQNLVADRAGDNWLFGTFPDAKTVLPNLLQNAASDNTVNPVGAAPAAETLVSVFEQPDWASVAALVSRLVTSLTSETARQRSEELVREILLQREKLLARNEPREQRVSLPIKILLLCGHKPIANWIR